MKSSNGDGLRRMKFLFEAAQLVKGSDGDEGHGVLNSFYNHTLKEVGLKLVVRMDSSVKRTFCSLCKKSYDLDDFKIKKRGDGVEKGQPKGISRICKRCGFEHFTVLKGRKWKKKERKV